MNGRIGSLALAALTAVLLAIVAGAASPPTARGATAPVVVIVMEYQSYEAIIGSARAPFINNTMVAGGALATNYHANVPRSLRDYLAMTAGIVEPAEAGPSENIFHQLQVAGRSWAEYEESMPSPCFTGKTYGNAPGTPDPLYTIAHNPAVHYQNITGNGRECKAHVLPYSAFSPAAMPEFSYVVPNQCNDMHSRCGTVNPIRAGDNWLAKNVPPMVAAGATVILTWDESAGAQHIVTVTYGTGAGTGTDSRAYTHFNLLAGLEDRFGVARVNGAIGKTPYPIA